MPVIHVTLSNDNEAVTLRSVDQEQNVVAKVRGAW